MNYGYARVSTAGQNLSEQKAQLREAGVDRIYSEKFTGTSTVRPQFQALLGAIKAGDTLTITKLDRLARNTREALGVIEELLNNNVSINVLNIGMVENTSIGRLIYTILLSVAELERDMIISRTQEGKAYAKKHNPNFKEGRPRRKLTPRHMEAIRLLEEHSYKDTATLTGISTATLQRIKKQYKEEQAQAEGELS